MLKCLLILSTIACVLFHTTAYAGGKGMPIEKFTISRNDAEYECFPSMTRLDNGRVIVTYRESDAHVAKEYTRIIIRTSEDEGKTWSARKVLVDSKQTDGVLMKYNCPKVQQLKDGRVLVVCDRYPVPPGEGGSMADLSRNLFWFSSDKGDTWSKPQEIPVGGIMPDEVVELDNGDWLLATQWRSHETGDLAQYVTRSCDYGKTWGVPVIVAARKGYKFCEASVLKLPGGRLVCYIRENSGLGRPIYKCISKDDGHTWEGPFETLMAAGHRAVAHLTQSGKVLITYRYQPGAKGPWAKNTFAYLESIESALEPDRALQSGIVMPLDHDRSPKSDGGYTGWVEVHPGSFMCVNYIVDDAPKAQIRGYRFDEADF